MIHQFINETFSDVVLFLIKKAEDARSFPNDYVV